MADRQQWSRRGILAAIGAAGGTAGVQALTNGGDTGSLYGGIMALQEAYNVAGELWIGPDSAKSNVAPDTGRVYLASDTQVHYHGDGTGWVKQGVGSSTEPVPEGHFQSLDTGSLIIGGKIYEEDDNSPIDVSDISSVTFTPAGSWDELIILDDHEGTGFNECQVNGDTSANYDYLTNADAQTTGASEWSIPRASERSRLHLIGDRNAAIRFTTPLSSRNTGLPITGRNTNVGGDITQFTLKDGAGSNRSLRARVFGRDI